MKSKFEAILSLRIEIHKEIELIEKETGFKIEQDKKDPNLFYITEPNAKMPFASIDYSKEINNAIHNATTRTDIQTSALRECSDLFARRVRGIIQERSRRSRAEIERGETKATRSEEIQTGGGRVREGSTAVQEGSGRLYEFNDSQIWRINPQERISLQNLSKEAQELHEHTALKTYQKTLSLNEDNPTKILSEPAVELELSQKALQQNDKDTNQTLTNHTNNNTAQQENKSINHFKDKLKEFKEKQTEKQINNVNKNLER